MFHGKDGITYKPKAVYNRKLTEDISLLCTLLQAVSAVGRRVAVCCCLAFFLWVMYKVLKYMYLALLWTRNILSANFKIRKVRCHKAEVMCWLCSSAMGLQGGICRRDKSENKSPLFLPPSYWASSPQYLIPLGEDIFSTALLQDSEEWNILLTEEKWDRCSFAADLAGRVWLSWE